MCRGQAVVDGEAAPKPGAAVLQGPGGSRRAVPDARTRGGPGTGCRRNGGPAVPFHGVAERPGSHARPRSAMSLEYIHKKVPLCGDMGMAATVLVVKSSVGDWLP